MNPTAILGLLGDLYTQIGTLQQRVAQLEHEATLKTENADGGNPYETHEAGRG